jgi:hypothetical protein
MDKDIMATLNEIKDAVAKAAETNATYTFSPASRSIFAPENLDEKIKYLVPTDTPLRNRIPRAKGMGQAAAWKKMTSAIHVGNYVGSAGVGTNTAITFADAAAPGETSQTYSATSASYKLLGRKLEVGGLALAASKGRAGEPDMQASRERIKMYEVMLGEEEMIISGNASTDTAAFDGLYKTITTNSGAYTFVTASGVGNMSRALFAYGAEPTLLVASARQLQALADDLEKSGSIQRVVVANGQQAGVTGGISLSKVVNPVTGSLIDVKPSRFVGLGGLLLTEKSPAGEAWFEMEDLIPMSRVDVPSTTFSYVSFILEATVLKLIAEPYQYSFTCGA